MLAMAESGHLFRIVLPLDGKRWEAVLEGAEDWSTEHRVLGCEGRKTTVFHAVDEQTVLVGTGDGVVIRLDQEQGENDSLVCSPFSGIAVPDRFLIFVSFCPTFRSVLVLHGRSNLPLSLLSNTRILERERTQTFILPLLLRLALQLQPKPRLFSFFLFESSALVAF